MALPGEMCPVKLFPGEWCPVKLFPGEMCPVTCRKGVFDDRVVEASAFEKMSLVKDEMRADFFSLVLTRVSRQLRKPTRGTCCCSNVLSHRSPYHKFVQFVVCIQRFAAAWAVVCCFVIIALPSVLLVTAGTILFIVWPPTRVFVLHMSRRVVMTQDGNVLVTDQGFQT